MDKEIDLMYTKSTRVVRDLPHGYINLTQFEAKIINTANFQRLKEIRQTTCQHVYPNARHTRFEHSLGVMQLVRRALSAIKENGIREAGPVPKAEHRPIKEIDDILILNAKLAGLLHDVGHCPFSHLGEGEFDPKDVKDALKKSLEEFNKKYAEMAISKDACDKLISHNTTHEMLSCYIILTKYAQPLSGPKLNDKHIIDIELILRSIIGYTYTISKEDSEIMVKNIVINLVNGNTLDMDRLDYVMRDSLYTGISVPEIDTQRLFKNLHVSKCGSLVYAIKAIPVLQNVIEARDNLYLWVYNHHAAVYTDFLYYYMLRKLARADYPPEDTGEEFCLGKMSKSRFFSVGAIADELITDNDLLTALRKQYVNCKAYLEKDDTEKHGNYKAIKAVAATSIQIFERKFLKAAWKSLFEFTDLVSSRFYDSDEKIDIVKKIKGEKGIFDEDSSKNKSYSEKFRKQIAQAVREKIKKYIASKGITKDIMGDSSFFIIPTSTKFYSLDAISKIKICFLKQEYLSEENCCEEYYFKKLTEIFPQRNYIEKHQNDYYYVYIPHVEDIKERLKCCAASKDLNKAKIEKLSKSILKQLITYFIESAKYFGRLSVDEFKEICEKEIREKAYEKTN